MRLSSPRIVQTNSYRSHVIGLIVVLALIAGVAWYSFDYGRNNAGGYELALLEENSHQREYIKELEAERTGLRERAAAFERSSQIDREAIKLVRGELKAFQDERMKLEQELAFLRGIVSSGVKKEGLFIQGFSLEPAGNGRKFRYRFTISQALKSAGTAQGWIHLGLDGMESGEVKQLSFKEITDGNVEKLKMRFNHFQDVDGEITLPNGFEPRNVIVEIKPTTKKLSPVKKQFVWLVAG
ncbi:MAG: DUF6776 family protein [Candidatus Sedimenticola sp. 4PFRAG1]